MENQVGKTLDELMELLSMCSTHKFTQDAYSAPGFADFLGRQLTIDDIPMESYVNEECTELFKDPKSIPWEDSIKNFILDLTSVSIEQKFSVCMLLTNLGYSYATSTISLLNKRHGSNTTIMVHTVPVDESMNEFVLTIRRDGKVELCSRVDKDYLVSDLLTWYMPKSTVVFCHDPSIPQYTEVLQMMPEIVWSISCTMSNFVKPSDPEQECRYICPVYSHSGSMETRAVGSNYVNFGGRSIDKYKGRINYYLKCIRGSKHSSGRCYDCQILYSLLTSLDSKYRKDSTTLTVTFQPEFLVSASNRQNIEL